MEALEESVRSIAMDGLVWGASKLVAVGYGIKKLQITLVVGSCKDLFASVLRFIVSLEDELVSLDDLQEKIAEFDDYVQSSDIAAMQSAPDVCPVFLRLTDVCRALETCAGGCMSSRTEDGCSCIPIMMMHRLADTSWVR